MSIESEIKRAITHRYGIEIKYKKYNGEISQRRLSDISYNNDFENFGYYNDHIKGYCHLRKEDRTFRISRITAVRVLPSGPWVSNNYLPTSCKSSSETSHSRPLDQFDFSTSSNSLYSYSSNKSSGDTSDSRGSSDGGCYIATMVYGSYNHPQVMVLRWYRDNVLQKNALGRLFICAYYYFSPKLVVILKDHDTINRLIKNILDKQVQWIKGGKIYKKK